MTKTLKRVLLRSGKSPFTSVSLEKAIHDDLIGTNSGNLIFSDAAHKILMTERTEVVSNGIRTNLEDAGRINKEYDAFVVPLANAFRPSFEGRLLKLARFIEKLSIPVVVLGVGAQSGLNYDPARLRPMEPAVRRFVSAVLDHSASIGVRGEFTEKYLRDMGFRDVEVIGCPSMFLNGSDFRVDKKTPELTRESRIAINGSHSAIKTRFGKILKNAHAQYPQLRYIGQNLSDAQQLHWRDLSDPNSTITAMPTHPAHPMYREGKVRVYMDPVTWINDLREFDYSFGGRIHGNIAALLAGTPATVLCHDSRTLELCRYYGIPYRKMTDVTPDTDPAELYAEADFSELTGGHQERFERFAGFLDHNGLENTFTHGDSGAAFDKQLSEINFPPAVQPWNSPEAEALGERLNWLREQQSDLSLRNEQLTKQLTAVRGSAQPSVYRRARRVVARPIKRALGPRD